jgi:predicted DNA-binding WGR domain protein
LTREAIQRSVRERLARWQLIRRAVGHANHRFQTSIGQNSNWRAISLKKEKLVQNDWTRYFKCEDGQSSKFWEITVSSNTVTTAWGRTGCSVQQHTRTFSKSEKAASFAAQVIGKKLRKGYKETDYVRLERISNEARILAKKLRFVGTEGGPLLILPQELLLSWNGVFDADGKYIFETKPCDYSRACEWKGKWVRSIRVGNGTGLVLQSNSAAAWLANESEGTYAVDQIDSIQGRLLDRESPTDFSTELTRLRILE